MALMSLMAFVDLMALVDLVEMVSEMVPGGLSFSEKVEYAKAVFVLLASDTLNPFVCTLF